MSVALQVKNLSWSAGSNTILDRIDLCIEEGGYLAVIGPNGAGKSTLLKCVMRIHHDWQGSIGIGGDDARGLSQRELARRVSYVPQSGDDAGFPFAVRDFVAMGRFPHLSPFTSMTRRDFEAVERAVETTGIQDLLDRRIGSLSGGERQRVHIAAALAQEAGLMLLDEPTASLDYPHQDEVRELLARLNHAQGVSIATVTHDVNDALFSASSLLALRGGRVVFSGSPGSLLEEGVLETIYGTPFRIVTDTGSGTRLIAPRGMP